MKQDCEQSKESLLAEMFPKLHKKAKEITHFEHNWKKEKEYLEVDLLDQG